MQPIVFALMFGIAGVSLFCAIHFWNRNKGYASLLQNGARKFQQLERSSRAIQQVNRGLEAKFKDGEQELKKMRRSLQDTKQSNFELNQELKNVRAEWDAASQDHDQLLASQKKCQQLIELLSLAKQENENLKTTASKTPAVTYPDLRKDVEKLKNKNGELIGKNKELKNSLQNAAQKPGALAPEDALKLKRKLNHYVHLYQGLKGHKEMGEEQNTNFKNALKHLAQWTLDKSGKKLESHANFGTLVGEALKVTGGSLIPEELVAQQASPKDAEKNENMSKSTL